MTKEALLKGPPLALDSLRPVKLYTGCPELSNSTTLDAFHAPPALALAVNRRSWAREGAESSDAHSRAGVSNRSDCSDRPAKGGTPALGTGSMGNAVDVSELGGAPTTATPGPVGSPGPNAAYIFPPYTVVPRRSLSPAPVASSVLDTAPRTMPRRPASPDSGADNPAGTRLLPFALYALQNVLMFSADVLKMHAYDARVVVVSTTPVDETSATVLPAPPA